MWEPLNGVSDSFVAGAGDPGAIASVRVKGRAYVPAFNTMGGPGHSVIRLHMGTDLNAGGGQWSAIEINGAVDLGPGGDGRVDAGTSE